MSDYILCYDVSKVPLSENENAVTSDLENIFYWKFHSKQEMCTRRDIPNIKVRKHVFTNFRTLYSKKSGTLLTS